MLMAHGSLCFLGLRVNPMALVAAFGIRPAALLASAEAARA
jgi:hypothetical protein